jgi:hypothetical protein
VSRDDLTRSQLDQLLRRLGFQTGKRTESCEAYYHADSETLILLPAADAGAPVRPADLMSVRMRLVSKGLLDDDAFAGFVETGRLPLAS